MIPTQEQIDIAEAVKTQPIIKINAFAGTGKTSTLQMIANTYRSKKILYLAFNKAIQLEAQSKFPSNVDVKTTHALAYGNVKRFAPMVKMDKVTNYRVMDISKILSVDYNTANAVAVIFENWCNSSSISLFSESTDDKYKLHLQRWFDLLDNGQIDCTHSFYLKKYHLLLRSEKAKKVNYDIVLLDEAQDTNDVTLDIFNCIESPRKILVGDRHQQIYSFRGSKNVIDKINATELNLTETFRFPQDIADVANQILKKFKLENHNIKTKISNDMFPEINSEAYISRTNALLIAKIDDIISDNKHNKFRTIRNPEEIFSLTKEIYFLLTGDRAEISKNKFLLNFKDEEDMDNYISETDDSELRTALKAAIKYKDRLLYLEELAIENFKKYKVSHEADCLYLTTAHTAKGLEWDRVEVADDFYDFAELLAKNDFEDVYAYYSALKAGKVKSDVTDEFNLFYVACTRAKKQLLIDESCNSEYLDMEINDFNYIVAKIYATLKEEYKG